MGRENKPWGYWTKERVFKESKKYTSRKEFRKENSSAYSVAERNRWLEEMPWLIIHCKPNGYWTKERVFEESKKYSTVKEFKDKCGSAYNVARKEGWLEEMNWLTLSTKPNGYWTKERVFEESKKYSSREEFRKGCSSAHTVAQKKNWFHEMTWLKDYTSKPRGYWTKEKVFEESKKYDSRSQFKKGNQSAYEVARVNKWLNEMIWLSNNHFSDEEKWNKEIVFEESKKYTSKKQFKKGNNQAYTLALKNKWLDEMPWLSRHTWIKEKVFEESRKYSSRGEFKKGNSSAYDTARKNNWLQEMTWLTYIDKHPPGYWTKEKVFKESKKYKGRYEFQRKNRKAYRVALKNGWLDEMTWLKNFKDLDKDRVDCIYVYKFEKQKTIYIGRTVNKSYRNSRHHKDKDDPVKKFVESTSDVEWIDMEVIEDNLTLREGQEKEAYWIEYYKNEGWNLLNSAKPGSLGSIGSGKWYYESCKNEASKYKDRTSFYRGASGAYAASKKKGWLDEFFPNIFSNKRAVDQLDLEGNLIQTFPSIAAAGKYLGVSESSISKICREKGKTLKGFKWRYHQEEEDNNKEE